MAVLRPLRLLRAPAVSLDAVSCDPDTGVCEIEGTEVPDVTETPTELVLGIEGLVCSVCANRATTALRSVPGVASARVDLETGQARLTLDEGAALDVATLQQAVERVVVGMRVRRWVERAVHGTAKEAGQ